MPYADRFTRLIGQFLDGLISAIPLFIALAISAVSQRLGVVLIIIAALFSVGYYFLADGLDGGSFAKRMLHMRVVDERTGEPCSFGQSLARNLLLAVLGPIDWIFIFGEQHQRLGDKLAGTIVRSTQ